jgi:hypothetical protein
VIWRYPHNLPVVEAVEVNGSRVVVGGNAVLTADRIQVMVL